MRNTEALAKHMLSKVYADETWEECGPQLQIECRLFACAALEWLGIATQPPASAKQRLSDAAKEKMDENSLAEAVRAAVNVWAKDDSDNRQMPEVCIAAAWIWHRSRQPKVVLPKHNSTLKAFDYGYSSALEDIKKALDRAGIAHRSAT